MIRFKNSNEAISYGERATLDQVIELKRLRDKALAMFNTAFSKGDMDKALELSFKSQFMREALEAATEKRCH